VCREAWSASLLIIGRDRRQTVRASDLAAPFPTVGLDTPVVEAARLLAGQNLPGLIVVDEAGRPYTVLPGTQVLRMAVPAYCQEDPALARVIDEEEADLLLSGLAGRTVRQCLPPVPGELPVVGLDATVVEMAALMARTRSPLVAVVDEAGAMQGAVTLDGLLDRVFAA
jgi:CBS domain-containing protein